MALFIAVLIALLVYPVSGMLSISLTKQNLVLRKKLIAVPLIISLITLLGMLMGISTVSSTLNGILATVIYLSFSQLLFLIYSIKRLVIKITATVIMIAVFGLGYITATIGILGLGFVIGDIEPDRVISLNDGILYRQYNQGNAISDYRNIEIVISKKIKFLPFLAHDIFSKHYAEEFHYSNTVNLELQKKGEPALYSVDFPVKYNADKKQIVLLDSIKRDTIWLK